VVIDRRRRLGRIGRSLVTDPLARLADASLCVLIGGGMEAASFARLVADLVDAGVPMLQVREKAIPEHELADRVRVAIDIARRRRPERPPLVVVNDRVDLAVQEDADGAHVGADDMPTAEARRRLDDASPAARLRLLGRTTHDLDEARRAHADRADYVGIGPCYPSATKSFAAFAAPAFLGAVVTEIPLPAFAIGGITLERVEELAALGIHRFAVASAITAAPAPAAAARAFLDRIAATSAAARSLSTSSTARAISGSSLGR
jgi:thiamine-phosphate pyrophosphorylase